MEIQIRGFKRSYKAEVVSGLHLNSQNRVRVPLASFSQKFPKITSNHPFLGIVSVFLDGSSTPLEFIAGPALFGPTLRHGKLLDGILKAAGPQNITELTEISDGCTLNGVDIDLSGKIAIFKRGGCQFVDKAGTAQEAGAVALLIVDPENDSYLKMSADIVNRHYTYKGVDLLSIPTLFVPRSSGASLLAARDSTARLSAVYSFLIDFSDLAAQKLTYDNHNIENIDLTRGWFEAFPPSSFIHNDFRQKPVPFVHENQCIVDYCPK
jgi:hypothetical protein